MKTLWIALGIIIGIIACLGLVIWWFNKQGGFWS